MAISRDEAIRSATRFVEGRDWWTWWSLKRLAAHEGQHPDLGRAYRCVQSLPGATDVPITTVWLACLWRVHRRGKLFPNSTDGDERFLDSSRNLTIATPFRLLARLRV